MHLPSDDAENQRQPVEILENSSVEVETKDLQSR
jgi:hypothetical protein